LDLVHCRVEAREGSGRFRAGSEGRPAGQGLAMNPTDRFCRLARNGDAATLFLLGTWRLVHLGSIDAELAAESLPALPLTLDGTALESLDTAAALALLCRLAAVGAKIESLANFRDAHAQVMAVVRERLDDRAAGPEKRHAGALAALGMRALNLRDLLLGHLNFLGRSSAELGRLALRPRTLRLKELVAQFDQVCLKAIPVVVLVTFLIGVVFAYLLGMQAEKYGANIFVVDGVAIGTCRELSPIIVAVIIAGRSGAAYTAQIGTMLLTEEIDAIRTLGLAPMRVLVVPRVIALTVALPLLVFIGDVAGIAGAMSVAGPMLDITPASFLARLQSALPLRHVAVGLWKAPVFALVIAIIACRMGMTVSRDTRSIGINTTSTVVQSIVAVILLDAFFAVFFQELQI
jgi:phospholipid/cholesterol/gamma-HCH transport system permease protein